MSWWLSDEREKKEGCRWGVSPTDAKIHRKRPHHPRPLLCLSRWISVPLLTGGRSTVSDGQSTVGETWAQLKLKTKQSNNSPYLARGRGAGPKWAPSFFCGWLCQLCLVVVVIAIRTKKGGKQNFCGGDFGKLCHWYTTYIPRRTQHRFCFYRIDIFLGIGISQRHLILDVPTFLLFLGKLSTSRHVRYVVQYYQLRYSINRFSNWMVLIRHRFIFNN